MKKLSLFVKEAKQTAEEVLVTSFEGTKMSTEQVLKMLTNLDAQQLTKLSAYLKSIRKEDYFVYEPSEDMILKDKDAAAKRIAEFIAEKISNK